MMMSTNQADNLEQQNPYGGAGRFGLGVGMGGMVLDHTQISAYGGAQQSASIIGSRKKRSIDDISETAADLTSEDCSSNEMDVDELWSNLIGAFARQHPLERSSKLRKLVESTFASEDGSIIVELARATSSVSSTAGFTPESNYLHDDSSCPYKKPLDGISQAVTDGDFLNSILTTSYS